MQTISQHHIHPLQYHERKKKKGERSTHLGEGCRVDSDGERPDVGEPAFELDAVGHGGETEDAGT